MHIFDSLHQTLLDYSAGYYYPQVFHVMFT